MQFCGTLVFYLHLDLNIVLVIVLSCKVTKMKTRLKACKLLQLTTDGNNGKNEEKEANKDHHPDADISNACPEVLFNEH